MVLKDDLRKKVPPGVQREPYFSALLDYLREHHLTTREQLYKSLNTDLKSVKSGLIQDHRAGAAAVKIARDKTIKLELLQQWLKLSQEYLR